MLIDKGKLLRCLQDHWLATSPNDNDSEEVKNERAAMCRGIDDVIGIVYRFPETDVWISVKDRLPERYERILTYDKYSGVRENWLLQSYPCVSWSYGFHVTHWMPMPEASKEEE